MVEDLTTRCQKVASEVEEAIKVAHAIKGDLDDALKNSQAEVDQLAKRIKDEFLANLEKRRREVLEEIDTIGRHAFTKLDRGNDELEKQRRQLRRALTFAMSVSENGSPYDMAAMYTTLTHTLTKLSDFKPTVVPENFGKVKVVASTDHSIEVPPLGHAIHVNPLSQLRSARYQDVSGEWVLEKQFGQGRLSWAVGMATFPSTGNIAVACWQDQIKIFDSDGVFKQSVDVKEGCLVSKPRGVVITNDNLLGITDSSEFVKVFDKDFKLVYKFKTLPPRSHKAISSSSSLCGLAINGDEHLIVGDQNDYIYAVSTYLVSVLMSHYILFRFPHRKRLSL